MKGESRRRAASKTATRVVRAVVVWRHFGVGRWWGRADRWWFEVEAELDDLEVPVAEVAPEELIDGVGGFVEAVVRRGRR
jgi:hypothetical protein